MLDTNKLRLALKNHVADGGSHSYVFDDSDLKNMAFNATVFEARMGSLGRVEDVAVFSDLGLGFSDDATAHENVTLQAAALNISADRIPAVANQVAQNVGVAKDLFVDSSSLKALLGFRTHLLQTGTVCLIKDFPVVVDKFRQIDTSSEFLKKLQEFRTVISFVDDVDLARAIGSSLYKFGAGGVISAI